MFGNREWRIRVGAVRGMVMNARRFWRDALLYNFSHAASTSGDGAAV